MMKKGTIAKVVFNLGVNKEFDYFLSSSLDVRIGSRVRVEFNKNIRTAVIVSFSKKTEIKGIKPILNCLDAEPSLSKEHVDFARRLSKEYICPLLNRNSKIMNIFLCCRFLSLHSR